MNLSKNFSNAAETKQRYEMKFFVTPELEPFITDKVQNFCSLDSFCKSSQDADAHYEVNDLYFDNPERMNSSNRVCSLAGGFKISLKVRSYGHEAASPHFLDLNYQVNSFVKKKRCQVDSARWADILRRGGVYNEIDADRQSFRNMEDFVFTAMTYQVRPSLFVQFKRKAFNSRDQSQDRITFDKEMLFCRSHSWKLNSEISSYKKNSLSDELDFHVMNFHWQSAMPQWMQSIVDEFKLTPVSFSKYDFAQNILSIRKKNVCSQTLTQDPLCRE